MANYTSSQLLASIHRWNEKFKQPEMRKKPSPAVMAFLKGTDAIVPNINEIKNSDQRTNTAILLNKKSSAAVTAKSHSHTGTISDSSSSNLSWIVRGQTFATSVKLADRQYFTWQEMFDNMLMSAVTHIHESIETYLISYLNTYKSQVVQSATPKNVTWDGSNYIAQVPAADAAKYGLYLRSFMSQQKYAGMLDVIADPAVYAQYEYYANQGNANATNYGFQYAGMNFYQSIDDLSFGAGYTGGAYAFEEGTVGLLSWNSPANRNNTKAGIYEYTTLPDPLGSGLVFDVHTYTAGANNSSNWSETQDVNQYWEVTATVAPVKAPESTANASTIFKVGLQSS